MAATSGMGLSVILLGKQAIDRLDLQYAQDYDNIAQWGTAPMDAEVIIPPLIAVGVFDYSTAVPDTWKRSWSFKFSPRLAAYARIFETGNRPRSPRRPP